MPKISIIIAIRALSVALSAGVLAGCIPITIDATQRLDVRVVDDASGAPIAGARVTLWHVPRESLAGLTDADGRIQLGPVRGWDFATVLPYDRYPPGGWARFEAPGYQTREARLRTYQPEDETHITARGGTVRLRRAQP